MANHGVFASFVDTPISTTSEATSGIPFVIGVAPLHKADAGKRAAVNVPFMATSFSEAAEALGYDDNWIDYNLCEFMYYHFKLAGCQPVIFLPLTETISSQEFNGDGTAKAFAITAKPDTVQKVMVGDTEAEIESYVKATGVVTLKTAPAVGTGNVVASYLTKPTAADVAAAVEHIDLCMARFSLIPDLIVAPGYSDDSVVAAAMAAKAAAINGLFKGKAIVDLEAASYTAAITAKNSGSYDKNQILCWPYAKLGDLVFHPSTVVAGSIAKTDISNDGVPYESPSNKNVAVDALVDSNGGEIILSLAQANLLNAAGIVTFLNFLTGWKLWGNYTAAYPGATDVKDTLIPISRMFCWVANTMVKNFWIHLDRPMNRRLIDTILDSANIWIDGLVSSGYLLGARIEMLEEENPMTDLMAGIIRLHIYMTPPAPAQEIDFFLEYDASYVQTALQ